MSSEKRTKGGGSYLVSTLSISLVLVVLGVLVFVLLNARQLQDYVKQNIGFSIIVRDNVEEAEIKKLNKILDTRDFVLSSQYISKEDAAIAYQKELGEDFVGVLGYNPLLPSIEIKLNPLYANEDSLSIIERRLLQNEQIQEVVYQRSLVHKLNENVRKISMVLLGASLLLVIISFTLIRNTIHLTVYSRRFLIKTMQLVGARAYFICKPFLADGFWYGLLAALLANTMLMGLLIVLQREFDGMINLLNQEILIAVVAFVVVFGIFLSTCCAWLSAYAYIRKDVNDLY
ncbi:MAG: cell division protein FtsX [Marinifilaceae bacterium]